MFRNITIIFVFTSGNLKVKWTSETKVKKGLVKVVGLEDCDEKKDVGLNECYDHKSVF